ncbi:hypothetical protein Pmani_023169 [Petrolisthes manimaculis]|uniref:C2H2-type domain-containing protein n=1 Tax=Petrolisthes manimaculis TaxID=1843537 RepID=A0AAE1PCG3_9EUCA|nr:hypothetical protein Pmani_023169 [Petrolisthes manimaculis]
MKEGGDKSDVEKNDGDVQHTDSDKTQKKSVTCGSNPLEVEIIKKDYITFHDIKSSVYKDRKQPIPYEQHLNYSVTVEIEEDSTRPEKILICTHESSNSDEDHEIIKLPFQVKHEIDDLPMIHEISSPDTSQFTTLGTSRKARPKKSVQPPTDICRPNIKQELDEVVSDRTVINCWPDESYDKLQTSIQNKKCRVESPAISNNAEGKPDRPRRQPKYQCDGCNQEFSHCRTLEAHSRECGKPVRMRRTRCIQPTCSRVFFHKSRMLEHYRRDHKGKQVEQQEEVVNPEMKCDSNYLNPEFICCNCEHVFTHLPELSAHERVCGVTEDMHNEEKYNLGGNLPYTYLSYKRKSMQKSKLLSNVRREHPKIKSEGVPNYSCANCLRTFTYRSLYVVHMKGCGKRSKVKKTQCIHPQCKREFFHKFRLIQHVEDDHPDITYTEPTEKINYTCAKCGQDYAHERSLRSHLKMCGKKGTLRRTKCLHSSCNREFFHRTRMIEHLKKDHPDMKDTETDDGPNFKCIKCNATYGHKQSLQRHMDHCSNGTKLKNTQCLHPGCSKRFFHISSMVRHMENDHTDMDMKIIEKHFSSLTDFKMWKEDEETKSFSYFSTRHSVTQNSGKSYLCFVCQHNGPERNPDTTGDQSKSSVKKWRQRKIRTGLVCPARMLVKENADGSVSVKYVKTHSHKVSQDISTFPPIGKRTFRKYQLAMKEADDKKAEPVSVNMVGEVFPGDGLDTLEVSVKADAASGEMITEAVMGTGYFDYMMKPNCGYVLTVEKANQTIKLYQQRTSSRFICYKVQRGFGKEEWNWEKRKVLWQQEELRENTLPEFDGVPYILNGTKVLECEYGVNRSAYHRTATSTYPHHHSPTIMIHSHSSTSDQHRKPDQEGMERSNVAEVGGAGEPLGPVSKKVNCPAKIFLKDVIKFPEFKVEANSRQEKRIKSNLLRLALRDGRAGGERRIYIQLPRDSDHCDHHPPSAGRHRRLPFDGEMLTQTPPLLQNPHLDTQHLSDSAFLHLFRVTRPLFQYLISEWRKKDGLGNDRTETSDTSWDKIETKSGRSGDIDTAHRTEHENIPESRRKRTENISGAKVESEELAEERTMERVGHKIITGMDKDVKTAANNRKDMTEMMAEWDVIEGEALAALYYLGSSDPAAFVSNRFQVKTERLLEAVMKFAEFLVSEGDRYIKWPQAEERVQIAETIQRDCGFPGVFGALDAALVHIRPPPSALADIQNYTYSMERESSVVVGMADNPKQPEGGLMSTGSNDNSTMSLEESDLVGTKDKKGRESAVVRAEGGSSEEAGRVKCALVLQFVADHKLTFHDIHLDAPKTGTRMQVFQESSAWVLIQQMISAESHLVGPVVYPLAPALMTPHISSVLSYQEALYNQQHQKAHRLATNAMTLLKSRFRRLQLLEGPVEDCAILLRAACILHNIALAKEEESVLNDLVLEYNSAEDNEGWHTLGLEEVVAEIGVLGGEEKRHYLTTIMTPH